MAYFKIEYFQVFRKQVNEVNWIGSLASQLWKRGLWLSTVMAVVSCNISCSCRVPPLPSYWCRGLYSRIVALDQGDSAVKNSARQKVKGWWGWLSCGRQERLRHGRWWPGKASLPPLLSFCAPSWPTHWSPPGYSTPSREGKGHKKPPGLTSHICLKGSCEWRPRKKKGKGKERNHAFEMRLFTVNVRNNPSQVWLHLAKKQREITEPFVAAASS